MTDIATLGLSIRSDGVVVATNRLKGLERQAGRSERIANKLAGSFARLATVAGTALVTVVGVQSVRAFADFERGLIAVGKTADISGFALEQLGANIQSIAREVPIATTELLGIAQAAGQLGVTGNDNILRFTETVGKLGISSNLAGEEAATSLARILTVTGTAIGEVDRLGSTIVRLGNNFAATEAEIAGATTRVAQATSQFGATAAEVTGIGAALTAIGVQAEAGGTVIGRAFQSINDAVRNGGEELQNFTAITGQSGDALNELFRSNPTAAFQELVEGLGRINAQGGDVTAALTSVGLEGTRVAQVLGTLATRSDVLEDALSQANDEWSVNAALNREAAVASESFSAQMQLVMNALNEMLVTVGQHLAPTIGYLAEQFLAATEDGDGLEMMARDLSTIFKLVVSSAVIAGEAIKAVGGSVTTLMHAAMLAQSFQFASAFTVLEHGFQDVGDSARDALNMVEGLWATIESGPQSGGMVGGSFAALGGGQMFDSVDSMWAALGDAETLPPVLTEITDATAAANDNLQTYKETMRAAGDAVRTSMMTPIQGLSAEMDHLRELLWVGAIDFQTFEQAGRMAAANVASDALGMAGQLAGALSSIFGESKALAMAEVVINTASAVVKTLAQYGATPWGFAAAGVAAATGAAQLVAIQSASMGSSSTPPRPSSGGGATRAAGNANPAPANTNSPQPAEQVQRQAVTINLQGTNFRFTRDELRDFIEQVAEAHNDGMENPYVTVNFS